MHQALDATTIVVPRPLRAPHRWPCPHPMTCRLLADKLLLKMRPLESTECQDKLKQSLLRLVDEVPNTYSPKILL